MTSDRNAKYFDYATNRNIRFYLTAPQACPYLPDRRERKVFTTLEGDDAEILNEALTHAGFRRSQNIAYRPACDMCAKCVSVRVLANEFIFDKKWRKILKLDELIYASGQYPDANEERYDLIKKYLNARHLNQGMSDMNGEDFIAMIEDCTNSTRIYDYRLRNDCEYGAKDSLIGSVLLDELSDGKSLIYSFFNPEWEKFSFGTYIILDQIRDTQKTGRNHVYLGYLIEGAKKMEYKARFKPLERLGPQGWSIIF